MLISVYEKEKLKRLEEKKLIEETIYYNPNNSSDEVFVRSSDGKMCDEIYRKAIKEKRYFQDDECVFVEKNFDKNILYNIVNYNDENEIIECRNCGNSGAVRDFINGCQYCRTVFNFGINDIYSVKKQFISQIHFKRDIMVYLFITIITYLILLFLPFESDSFNWWSLIPAAFIISISPSLIINIFISVLKQKNNSDYGLEKYAAVKWKIKKDEKVFYNNFKAELMIKLYEKVDLIDFEIIDYLNVDFLSEDEIIVTCKIRELYYKDKMIVSEEVYKVKMHYNNKACKSNNVINCLSCGNTIDITQEKCSYCGRINDSKNEWIMDSIEKSNNEINS